MKSLLLIATLSIYLFFFTTYSVAETNHSIHWTSDRDYSLTVFNSSNQAILAITVKYQGKAPLGNEKINHNWKQVDTNFYQESFKNLTDSVITIQTIKYHLNRGKLQTPRVKGKEKIMKMYGTTKIKPNTQLNRNNAWVWAQKNNKLHRSFIFSYDNESIEADIPLIYQR